MLKLCNPNGWKFHFQLKCIHVNIRPDIFLVYFAVSQFYPVHYVSISFSGSKADQLGNTGEPENKRQRVEHEQTGAERQNPVHKDEGGGDSEGPDNEREGEKTGGDFEVPRHTDGRGRER